MRRVPTGLDIRVRSSLGVAAAIVIVVASAIPAGRAAHSTSSVGEIAFSRDCSIFVIGADGNAQRRLTRPSPAGCSTTPAWSPDGRRIAFVRTYEDPSAAGTDPTPGVIYIMNADGTGARRITGRLPDVGEPQWSPDGTAIAFDERAGGVSIVGADGTTKRVLAPNLSYPAQPSWSPDGRRIAIVRDVRFGRGAIYTVSADGGALRRLTVLRDGEHLHPAWSPNGRTIVFTLDSEARSVRAGGGGERPLRTGLGRPWMSWSPDGSRILVAFGRPGLWVMRPNGTQLRALTRIEGDHGVWSSDGRRIALARTHHGFEIYVMNADGRGLRKVALGSSPTWRPTQ